MLKGGGLIKKSADSGHVFEIVEIEDDARALVAPTGGIGGPPERHCDRACAGAVVVCAVDAVMRSSDRRLALAAVSGRGHAGAVLVRRLIALYAGLWLYGFSMAVMVRADLGLDPWDVFHQGVARHVPISWLSPAGWCTTRASDQI
ncbi:hypothetical protein C5E45_28015 [Nocardia nova]|uniref:Uncharacterized protein n=1 Tax=Nocardia nova TaxID=37330 RepID=A0A2S6AIL2_9NOCA|nr:hypothetical protein [Nocardia nova]PPJ23756.1 hypothetical protein C5E41_24240 [Nocardia nova]PPJ35074.1 hypothetical protein C5E45_28015 [Nocardia nova]